MNANTRNVPGPDRRETKRLPIEVPADVGLRMNRRNLRMRLTIFKPSCFGLGLQTPECIPVGTRVKILAETDKCGWTRPCVLSGRVVWSRQKSAKGLYMAGVKLSRWRSRNLRDWQAFILEKLRKLENQ